MDRPRNARIVGFALYGVIALVLLPLLFSDPVDPRSTIHSRFAEEEGAPVVVTRPPTPTPSARPPAALASARPVLPVANPSAKTPEPSPTTRPVITRPPVATPRVTPTPKPVATRSEDTSKPAWRLQLASYSDQASAERFVKRLREDGLEPRVIGAQSGSRRVWRVSVEFRASAADARAFKQKIDSRYRISAMLQSR